MKIHEDNDRVDSKRKRKESESNAAPPIPENGEEDNVSVVSMCETSDDPDTFDSPFNSDIEAQFDSPQRKSSKSSD